jgi:hypothetical protein
MKKKNREKTDIPELLIKSNGKELYITTTLHIVKSQKRKRNAIMNDDAFMEKKVEIIETPNCDENELFEIIRKY